MKNLIGIVENLFAEDGFDSRLKRKIKGPLFSGYKPDFDVTDGLGVTCLQGMHRLLASRYEYLDESSLAPDWRLYELLSI
eukprot:2789807-Ditylum_brightwellii.AAC.1